MNSRTLNQNLIQLTRVHFVNAYLVREDDGFTLVDTMLSGAADDLIAAAQAAGGQIRRIALTHGHSDHAGSVEALKQKLGPDVQVLLSDPDARILAGEKVVEGKLAGSWPKVQWAPDGRIAPGDRVGSLEVVASPGHTPGHMAFVDTRDRTLIAGDVFTSYGQVAVTSSYYWRFPLATMGTTDKATDLESARALRALDPPLLVVGHGPATAAPGDAMDKAIARASS